VTFTISFDYESATTDNDLLVERIKKLKSKYDVLATRKELKRSADWIKTNPPGIPLQLIRKALTNSNRAFW
jgi:hypothetical protein